MKTELVGYYSNQSPSKTNIKPNTADPDSNNERKLKESNLSYSNSFFQTQPLQSKFENFDRSKTLKNLVSKRLPKKINDFKRKRKKQEI